MQTESFMAIAIVLISHIVYKKGLERFQLIVEACKFCEIYFTFPSLDINKKVNYPPFLLFIGD